MNLYEQKEKNVRRTWLLMIIFLIVIVGLGWFLSYYYQSSEILWWALAISLALNFFSYWFSDKIVLGLAHGRRVEFKDNPELFRLVENICLTAGLPMPKIYLLPERALNAFATGRNPKNGAIAITEGLLEKLEKSELEGVLAHEISHIGNRDTLLQTVVVVSVGLIVIVSDIFLRSSIYSSRRRDNDSDNQTGSVLAILGLILILISPLIAKLIQLAISRRREFIADSSAALLTRYPEGLASALEKISTDVMPQKFASKATAHLYIANPLKGARSSQWLTKIFSTHPPIAERIKILRDM